MVIGVPHFNKNKETSERKQEMDIGKSLKNLLSVDWECMKSNQSRLRHIQFQLKHFD